MVVVNAQGEILGMENMIKMKIGKNEKMGLGERIDANFFFFKLYVASLPNISTLSKHSANHILLPKAGVLFFLLLLAKFEKFGPWSLSRSKGSGKARMALSWATTHLLFSFLKKLFSLKKIIYLIYLYFFY
jgi:hypothetical protein